MLTSTSNQLPSLPSLSFLINDVTRSTHAHLNKLIISLLPLALPPYTSSPLIYAHGMSHILPIYEAMEITFRDLIMRSDRENKKAKGNEKGKRLLEALKELWIPEMGRTERLRRDIKIFRRHCRKVGGEGEDDIQWHPEDRSNALRELKTRLQSSIPAKPHLLLASTWLLYMALFSGGRYIRFRLLQAGPGFWNQSASYSTSTVKPKVSRLRMSNEDMEAMGLSFWTFAGERDGEDLKLEFKRRFKEVEALLTEDQIKEIVFESAYVMQDIYNLVREAADILRPSRVLAQSRGTSGTESLKPDPDIDMSHAYWDKQHKYPWLRFELPRDLAQRNQKG